MPETMTEAATAALAPMFVADHPALDLLNSRASPAGVEFDWLADHAGLVGWLVAARVGDPPAGLDAGKPSEDLAVPARVGEPPAGLDAGEPSEDLTVRARALREWLRGFVTSHAGRPLGPLGPLAAQDLAPLNEVLAADCAHRQIVTLSGRATWSPALRHDPAARLLQPLATAVGDLISGADFSRIRLCEGKGCTLWFLDTTRAGKRRWCSMAVCGNRAKAAAHRGRLR